MPDPRDTISEFLRNLGIVVEWIPVPAGTSEYNYGDGVHGGLPMRFWVYPSIDAFSVEIAVGWVPKAGVAALYRQMLNQSILMPDAKYGIRETPHGGNLILASGGFLDHLTLAQFKLTLDNLTKFFWANAVPLIRDFQIPGEVPL